MLNCTRSNSKQYLSLLQYITSFWGTDDDVCVFQCVRRSRSIVVTVNHLWKIRSSPSVSAWFTQESRISDLPHQLSFCVSLPLLTPYHWKASLLFFKDGFDSVEFTSLFVCLANIQNILHQTEYYYNKRFIYSSFQKNKMKENQTIRTVWKEINYPEVIWTY